MELEKRVFLEIFSKCYAKEVQEVLATDCFMCVFFGLQRLEVMAGRGVPSNSLDIFHGHWTCRFIGRGW